MAGMAFSPLWAVHIADGVLTWPWLAGGFAVAAVLALRGAWRIRDEEIPRVALLTAAFFVASLVHVRVGPTSAHLLLNGLVGVLLGWRSGLAIPIGLFLQAALIGHGGFTTLGINSCVMTLPALLAGWLFALLQRVPWVRAPWFRALLVAVSAAAWALSLVYGVGLLLAAPLSGLAVTDLALADRLTFHPVTLAAAGLLAVLAAWAERRLENAPEFPLGLLIGEGAVLATALLNSLVLWWGGADDWRFLALVVGIVHIPIAAVEGVILGFAVGFLARVKPQMLDWVPAPEETECVADSAP
jgi:cobalt/nickel transport system permease protein